MIISIGPSHHDPLLGSPVPKAFGIPTDERPSTAAKVDSLSRSPIFKMTDSSRRVMAASTTRHSTMAEEVITMKAHLPYA